MSRMRSCPVNGLQGNCMFIYRRMQNILDSQHHLKILKGVFGLQYRKTLDSGGWKSGDCC
eukprot:6489741-Amphidinium_carterae.2